jgi:hypothetical protein
MRIQWCFAGKDAISRVVHADWGSTTLLSGGTSRGAGGRNQGISTPHPTAAPSGGIGGTDGDRPRRRAVRARQGSRVVDPHAEACEGAHEERKQRQP